MTADLTEDSFQAMVVELAGVLGWRHLHVRRSIGKGRRWTTATNVIGWPDLLLWHERQRRVIAAELKSESGQATDEQVEVLGSLHAAGIETYLWRPSDFTYLSQVLGPRTTSRRPA